MKNKYSYLLFIILIINRKMTSTNEYQCGICLDNLEITNNFMITQCGHAFHSSCCLAWTFRGNFNCPLCVQALTDKKTINDYNRINNQNYEFTLNNSNDELTVYLYKMIINDLTYFISSDNNSKVFFNIFDEDIDFLDEIGHYDWNLNRIIYKYDVTRHVINDKIYLITSNGEVYDYRTHILINDYKNDSLDKILNILEVNHCNDNIYLRCPHMDPECNDSEDFVLPGFFYFRGQTYKLENGEKVDISTALGLI